MRGLGSQEITLGAHIVRVRVLERWVFEKGYWGVSMKLQGREVIQEKKVAMV